MNLFLKNETFLSRVVMVFVTVPVIFKFFRKALNANFGRNVNKPLSPKLPFIKFEFREWDVTFRK